MAPVLSLDGPSRFYGKLLPSTGRVLVLGAGDGLVAAALASRGHEVVAVEGSTSLRGLVLERKATLAHPERLVVVSDDPRTLSLEKKFSLVIAPHQALGLARSPDELHALLSVVARHLEPEGTFAFDALNEPASGSVYRPRGVPHLRERTEAIHPLSPLRLSASTLDEALDSVGLVARERFSDFNESPFAPDAALQVVVGGLA
ncbi:MAG: class I SAM-dependent methyltransferase [Archangium sp.]|nr:class I SAM-dependent methyltransferase [Archangium sp.]